MAQRRQNPDFQPVRITTPVTAPVTQFYDPSALAQQQDFQNSMEIAKAFSGLSSSLAGFAKTYTKAEIKAGEEEFAALSATPQKLRAKATEYIESAGRLAPWRVRSFLQMYGGQTYGSQYRSGVFDSIDSLSEPMNPDGTLKTDQQVQSEINAIADRLEVPDSYYVRQGFNRARLGIDNELMNRVGQLRVAKAKKATEDQAMTEALELIQRTVNPDDIEKGFVKILNNIYATGLNLTSGGREAVVRAVASHIDRELEAADPDYDRVDELLSIFIDGQVGDLRLTPELTGTIEELQNKAEKAKRFTAFANGTTEVTMRSSSMVTDAVLARLRENGGTPLNLSEMNALIDPLLRENFPDVGADVRSAARERVREMAMQVQNAELAVRGQLEDSAEMVTALGDLVRSYAPDAEQAVRNAFHNRQITRATYEQFTQTLRDSYTPVVERISSQSGVLMPSTDVVPLSQASTLTEAERASLNQMLEVERGRIMTSVAEKVTRNSEFREAMGKGDVYAAQRMLTDAVTAAWQAQRDALQAKVTDIQTRSFSNLKAVARGRAMSAISDAVSSIYPEDSIAGGAGLTAELRGQQRELREYLVKRIESGVISTAAIMGRDQVTPNTFDDAWILSTVDDGIASYTQRAVGTGRQVGEYAKTPIAISQMPAGRENAWSLLIAQDAANRGEQGELEARRRLEVGAEDAVAAIRQRVDSERLAVDTAQYPVTGVIVKSDKSVEVSFRMGSRLLIETAKGVVRPKAPFLLSTLSVTVPYSVRDWNSLTLEQRNRAITQKLATESEVDLQETRNRVFDLGMIGFDIDQLSFAKIGAMDVSRGKPFESLSDPFAIDLTLGPPNPKVFLYGTKDQWAQMNSDYADYEEQGVMPSGPLQDLVDLFENSYTPEQIMLLQGGLRVNRGLAPRN